MPDEPHDAAVTRAIGADWGGRCPAAWFAIPAVSEAARLVSLAKISPLSGWPESYVAGVVDAMEAFA